MLLWAYVRDGTDPRSKVLIAFGLYALTSCSGDHRGIHMLIRKSAMVVTHLIDRHCFLALPPSLCSLDPVVCDCGWLSGVNRVCGFLKHDQISPLESETQRLVQCTVTSGKEILNSFFIVVAPSKSVVCDYVVGAGAAADVVVFCPGCGCSEQTSSPAVSFTLAENDGPVSSNYFFPPNRARVTPAACEQRAERGPSPSSLQKRAVLFY